MNETATPSPGRYPSSDDGPSRHRRRLIVAVTGASGAVYGVRLLELLREHQLAETHAIISRGARWTIRDEMNLTMRQVADLADHVYDDQDLSSAPSSGSFRTDGMLVAPCSIKTLSGIANSYDDNLVVRAADVSLKERRPLVLLVRETPLHLGHLRLMVSAAEAGAVIMPPVPAFYSRPEALDDIVTHTLGRALDQFGIRLPELRRWQGPRRLLEQKAD